MKGSSGSIALIRFHKEQSLARHFAPGASKDLRTPAIDIS